MGDLTNAQAVWQRATLALMYAARDGDKAAQGRFYAVTEALAKAWPDEIRAYLISVGANPDDHMDAPEKADAPAS